VAVRNDEERAARVDALVALLAAADNSVAHRERNRMVARSTPEDRDIVVQGERREGKRVWVLHTALGLTDTCTIRGKTPSRKPSRWQQQVRAWVTDGDYDFTLLEDFRVVESV